MPLLSHDIEETFHIFLSQSNQRLTPIDNTMFQLLVFLIFVKNCSSLTVTRQFGIFYASPGALTQTTSQTTGMFLSCVEMFKSQDSRVQSYFTYNLASRECSIGTVDRVNVTMDPQGWDSLAIMGKPELFLIGKKYQFQ